MPRRPRIKLAGIPQHIVQRGINREACFFANQRGQARIFSRQERQRTQNETEQRNSFEYFSMRQRSNRGQTTNMPSDKDDVLSRRSTRGEIS